METHFVYIRCSASPGKYYIDQPMDLENRLRQHNSHFFKDAHTKIADDWILKLSILCTSRKMAWEVLLPEKVAQGKPSQPVESLIPVKDNHTYKKGISSEVRLRRRHSSN